MLNRIVNWRLFMLVGCLVAIAGLVAGCGGSASAASSGSNASNGQNITAYVFPDSSGIIKGPDGQGHDAIVPSSFVVTAGTPVHLQVTNYDDMSHSITSPGLNLNLIIKPGLDTSSGGVTPVTTDFTFTPTTKGTFRWNCALKCDPWSMSNGYSGPGQEGFMAGFIVVQ